MSVIDDFEKEMEKDRDFQKNFTIYYKNLTQKEKDELDFSKCMCNIWGYIQALEARIKILEETLKV